MEDIEHFYCTGIVSGEKEEEYKQQQHASKGSAPLFTQISLDGNLCTTVAREENIHDLASPGTDLSKNSPKNIIPTNQ